MKIYAIEWYRYFFACFICVLHFKEYFGNPYPFGGAYLAVEFFFIVSGFFLMKTILEEKADLDAETAVIIFAKNKFKRFYPQYIISWIILAVYCVLVRNSTNFTDLLIYYLDEIFMIQMIGAGRALNAAMWYVSALYIVSVIFYYIAKKNIKIFTNILCPIIVLLIYSYYYQTNGSLAGIAWKNELIVRNGIWRAMAGLCVGCIVYNVYLYFTNNKQETTNKKQQTIIGSIYELIFLCVLSALFYGSGCTVKDFTLVGLMAVMLFSIVYNNSYLTTTLNGLKIDGSYAYAMYCNHWVVNYFIRDFFPGKPFFFMVIIYLILTICLSIITTKFINKLKHIIKEVS